MEHLPRTTLMLSVFVLLTGMASLFNTDTLHYGQEYLAQVSPSISQEGGATHDTREGRTVETIMRTAEVSASTTAPAVPVPQTGEGLHCPLLFGSAYYVVDFTDSSVGSAVLEQPLRLPTGTYRVDAVSYRDTQIDGITPRGHEREQRWYGEILDGDGALVAQTQMTRGLSPGETVREIIADPIVLAGGKYTVVVQHSADLSDGSARIIPICIAFIEIHAVENRGVSTSVEFQ